MILDIRGMPYGSAVFPSRRMNRIDPKNELIAIYMVQETDPDRIAPRNQFRSMVQAAIVD